VLLPGWSSDRPRAARPGRPNAFPGTPYTYDAAGRLVGVQNITHMPVYTYNGDGVRVAQFVIGSRVPAILGARVYNDATGRKECEKALSRDRAHDRQSQR